VIERKPDGDIGLHLLYTMSADDHGFGVSRHFGVAPLIDFGFSHDAPSSLSASPSMWYPASHFVRCGRYACAAFMFALAWLPAAGAATSPSPFSVLRAFNRTTDGTGNYRHNRLVQVGPGFLYGTNPTGGASGAGTLFRVATDGSGFVVLKHFTTAEGPNPVTLLAGSDGKLYGIALTPVSAIIFTIATDGSGFNVLRRFASGTDAYIPETLIESDGMLYGMARATTSTDNAHAIFRMNRDGSAFAVVRTLSAANEGAGEPTVIQGPDGRLYGATQSGGGASVNGIVFRVNRDGSAFTILKRFQRTDGRTPNRLAFSGNRIFGTTVQGGAQADYGVLYRMEADGSGFTVLHQFLVTFPPAAGENPTSGVTVLPDGNIYGVTNFGGELRGFGTIYRYDPTGNRMIFLKQFSSDDGIRPAAELLFATDGNLYGVTPAGGALGAGTIFTYALNMQGADVGLVATVGRPFLHEHSWGTSATGLPAGLSITGPNGTISGTPTQAGTFQVTISGTFGFSMSPVSATITLTVAKGAATVSLSNLTQSHDGLVKRVTVTTVPAGLPVFVTYDGSSQPPFAPGSYSVSAVVTDPSYSGFATGTLVIGAAAPRLATPLADLTTVAGTSVNFRADVTGSAPLTFKWQRKARGAESFSDLVEGGEFTGVATSTLTIAAPTTAMNGDHFRLVISNLVGTSTSDAVTLLVRHSSVLANVSVRARAVPGETLTLGFVTSGSRALLVRGIGPGLQPFIGNAAAGDPALLVSTPTNPRLAENENWGGGATLTAAFNKVGAFALPAESQDAAVLIPVNGQATARVTVKTAGLTLVEAYDADGDGGDRLVNLSTLHNVGVGADALVTGFNVSGTGAKRILIRGIGPGLRTFGVNDAIENPVVQVHAGNGTLLASNDDWDPALTAAFSDVGAFALVRGSSDSALLVTLPPGTYTVQLANAQSRTGPGLIEIYEVP
jgi:uncharacterized repeat protein (TIGR03803 family)